MQALGMAAVATSNAVLTASEVAAVEEEVLEVESESWTIPDASVVATATETTGVEPAVTLTGRVPVMEETTVPLDARVMRPCASTVMLAAV
jgi:hypothetical protein